MNSISRAFRVGLVSIGSCVEHRTAPLKDLSLGRHSCLNLPSALMRFGGRLLLTQEWNSLSRMIVAERDKFRKSATHVSPVVVKCLVAAEDRRFKEHGGVDVIAFGRAILHAIAGRGLEGGSTIEQQLVRTLTGRRERTLNRKLSEMALASLLSKVVSKPEVAALYLRSAYFGWQMNGYASACKRLGIGSNGTAISMSEAAGLVARLKYPEPRQPAPERTRLIVRRAECILQVISATAVPETRVLGFEPPSRQEVVDAD